MMKILFRMTFAVALVLVLTATGLWAAGAEEAPAAAAEKEMVLDPTTGKMVTAPEYGGTLTWAAKAILRILTCGGLVAGRRTSSVALSRR